MTTCSVMRGIECRAHCAIERVCANKAVGVMRAEVSVAIAATRNSSGIDVLFCVREKLSQQLVCVSVCFDILNSSFLL